MFFNAVLSLLKKPVIEWWLAMRSASIGSEGENFPNCYFYGE